MDWNLERAKKTHFLSLSVIELKLLMMGSRGMISDVGGHLESCLTRQTLILRETFILFCQLICTNHVVVVETKDLPSTHHQKIKEKKPPQHTHPPDFFISKTTPSSTLPFRPFCCPFLLPISTNFHTNKLSQLEEDVKALYTYFEDENEFLKRITRWLKRDVLIF